ncbi:MAG: spore photoproduct lyase family protein [Alkalispirochaeta sp.]
MSCWTYYSETIDHIYWVGTAAEHPVRARVERRLRSEPALATIVSQELEEGADLPAAQNTARTILVRLGTGDDVGRCPGTHGHLCCNYLTLNVYVGCTLGCTYCIMQSYLRNRTLEVRLPPEDTADTIRALALDNPHHTVRLGTGEVGDSLLYDPLFDLSSDLITALSDVPNLRFELKTKTDYVDHLPPRGSHGGNVVVAFSLNPDAVVSAEEGVAASLDRRLAAARRAVDQGYLVAFHFDPMVRIEDWSAEYAAVVARLEGFRASPPEWISLGTLRYPPTLRPFIEARPYGLGEFVSSGDGKMRYLQKERGAMYRMMRTRLAEVLPNTPVYLCMESSAMWRHLQHSVPDRSGGLSRIMRPLDLRVLQEESR